MDAKRTSGGRSESARARQARAPGPIAVSDELRPILVAIRRTLGITSPPTVCAKELATVETYLRGSIPNDLLAYWLALGQPVGALVELTRSVALYYEAMEEKAWRRTLRFAHVAFDETYNSDEGILCARLGEAPTKIEHWMFRKGEGWKPTFLKEGWPGEPEMVSFCRWKYGADTELPVDFDAPIPASEIEALVPEIVADAARATRRVKHPKFGKGIVLNEIPPDKLEIDFGAHGTRKLLASTVEDV